MHRLTLIAVVLAIFLVVSTCCVAQTTHPPSRDSKVASEEKQAAAIDFERARELLQKRQRGEQLSPDERIYLQRAMAAREAQTKQGDRRTAELASREKTGLKPLNDMSAEDRYKGEDGGLYGQGRNFPPVAHFQEAEKALAGIAPLDASGKPNPDGKIVFVSISMSNATQEFSLFKRLADRDPDKSPRVTIVDCAQGGQAMAEWVNPQAGPWREADRRIAAAGVTAQQVQVAWIKLANKGPQGELAEHGKKLERDTLDVIQNAKSRFPNLRVAYLSSRIYGGYATNRLNPEPYAYESAFVVRWLIQRQMKLAPELNFDIGRGPVKAPLLLWGPYLWADGTTPRGSDKLIYARDDLGPDGTHPSEQGRLKVANLMLDFFKTDALANKWFTDLPKPHPEAIANLHPPGDVDNPDLVPFIVVNPGKLPGIVVDETSATLVGKWQYSTHTPPYVGLGYLHDQKENKGEKSVTFVPDLPRDGLYEVRLAHCFNIRRATNTPVTIHYADGEKTIRINQQETAEHDKLFRTLGTFRFTAGRTGWVRISTEGTEDKYVIADAIQWLPLTSQP